MKPIAYYIFLFGMFTQINAQVIKSLQKVSDKAYNVIQPQKRYGCISSNLGQSICRDRWSRTYLSRATAPFGMIQLSPDTRYEGWDGCSGYHYS